MSKKMLFIALALFGLLFSEIAGQCFADIPAQLQQAETYKKNGQYEQTEAIYKQIVTDYAFQAQKNLAILYVAWDKQREAQAALEKLVADFSQLEAIAAAVTHVADEYRKLEKHGKACELYHYVVDNWPRDEHAMWSQTNLVISNTCLVNDSAADTAFEKLRTQYSGYKLISKAVCMAADNYRKLKKHRKARELYQYVLVNWPDGEGALWSQMGLAISNLWIGNDDATQDAIDKLLTDFAKDERVPTAACLIGDEYRKLNKYENACQLYEYVVQNWPDVEYALWSQMGLAISNIWLGEYDAAQEVVDKLCADFAEDERMAIAGCLIADEYRKMEKHQEACELYNYVVDNWPNAEHAMWSQVNMGNIKLQLDDDKGARAIFDKVLADFAGHPILPRAVDLMAYGYYRKALLKRKEGLNEQANWYYQKTIAECERIITQLPETRYTTAEACYFSGVCYGRLGQHEKAIEYYQKVVDNWPEYKLAWSAQFRIVKMYKWLLRFGVMSESEAEAAITVTFEHLVKKFPDCPAVSAAHKWLNYYHNKSSEGGQK